MSGQASVHIVERIIEDPVSRLNGGIGFVGPDVPVEALLAAGRPFGHLPWQAGGPTPFSDRVLESSFPFWARSLLEQWHSGAFDGLDAVVFSRAADASQRLYYYVAELKRRGRLGGPDVVMFDIAHIRRESSVAHTADAIGRLCRALDVESQRLTEAIGPANALREKLAAIAAARTGEGPLYERIGRAALWSDPSPWIDEVTVTAQRSSRRVVLAGSVPPDDRIHAAVEGAGASVVAEAHMYALTRLGPGLDGDGARSPNEPAELMIARHLQMSSASPRAWLDRAQRVAGMASEVGAAAVIIWLTREDEALAWQVPSQKKMLDERGVPTLVLPASDWRFDADQRDRLMQFLKGEAHATA